MENDFKLSINYRQLETYWGFLTYDYPKKALIEIILMNIEDSRVYEHVKQFALENPNIIMKKNCQLFLYKHQFEELKNFLEYKDNLFIKHSKICYSIIPRFLDKNNVAGGYKYIKFVDMLFLDIEKKSHDKLEDSEIPYIKLFVENIIKRLEQYGLNEYVIIASGNGYHLNFKLRQKPHSEKRKLGYKQFIIKLEEELNSELYKIDHCVNFSRCIALPETINHKAKKQVKILSLIPKNPINDFYINMGEKKKTKNYNKIINPGVVRKSREYFVLSHPEVESGDLHNIVLFSLKLFLKAKGYNNGDSIVGEIEDEINSVRGTNHILDLETGIDGKEWSPGTMANWMKKHKKWVDKYGME